MERGRENNALKSEVFVDWYSEPKPISKNVKIGLVEVKKLLDSEKKV